jgi:hypothetical protein
MLLQLAILFILTTCHRDSYSVWRFIFLAALSVCNLSYVRELRQIKHPHLSVVCFLKNVLRTALLLFLLASQRFEPGSFRCERGAFYTPF